jgi:hypothetical protein
MFRYDRWIVGALLFGGVIAAASARGGATQPEIGRDPAVVTLVAGAGNLHRIKLDADAASRIGLETDTVRELTSTRPKNGGVPLTTVDFAAVLYDKSGATWVYTKTGTLTFQRKAVTVIRVDGDRAVLSSGPAVGSAVATVGAAELRGSEDGVPGE